MKPLAAALVLVVAAACGSGGPAADSGESGRSPGSDSQPGAGSTGGGGAATGSAGSSRAGYDDLGALGSMVRVFLRAAPARRLTVEVDYIKGRAPSSRALAHLTEVLRGVADKPDGIAVTPGNEIATGRDRWSIGHIKELEKANRSGHSSGKTATMWIAYLDGVYDAGDGALGVAYSATAAAIFRDRIDDATTAIINATAVERAVITHEAGHLLALVNLGYTSAIDHEDKANPHHSRNEGSVMYWAVEDLSLKNLLAGGPPDTFDDADKADLAALKRG